MKTIIVLFFALIISPLCLNGQDDTRESGDYSNRELRDFFEKYSKENPKYMIVPNDKELREFRDPNLMRPEGCDSLMAQLYPGSSRYYAKRRFQGMSYEQSFIKEPDDSGKYFLIIRDPLRHTVTK